jgi:hypothetical protein
MLSFLGGVTLGRDFTVIELRQKIEKMWGRSPAGLFGYSHLLPVFGLAKKRLFCPPHQLNTANCDWWLIQILLMHAP